MESFLTPAELEQLAADMRALSTQRLEELLVERPMSAVGSPMDKAIQAELAARGQEPAAITPVAGDWPLIMPEQRADYTLRIMADGALLVADRVYVDSVNGWGDYDLEVSRWQERPENVREGVTIQLSDRDGDVLAEVTL